MAILGRFIQRKLDPADRLGEILFGLIMALAIIGAVRVGEEAVDNRGLLIAIVGCNLAWALVDAVMYVLVAVFERGRKFRLLREVQRAATDDAALEGIHGELGGALEPLVSPEVLRGFYAEVLKTIRSTGELKRAWVQRDDLLGGVAVALVIMMATLPVVAPYVLIANTTRAVRMSEAVAVGLLFLLGHRWGKIVGANPWALGAALTLIGGILVGLTVLLGG